MRGCKGRERLDNVVGEREQVGCRRERAGLGCRRLVLWKIDSFGCAVAFYVRC